MKRFLSKASPVLKLLFGAGLLTWMASTGKLNFAQIGRGMAHWPLMVTILAVAFTQIALTTWRWRMLLAAQDIPLTYGQVWNLTMIGALFNVLIPGAVGGDLIKGYYIARATHGRKTHAATSIVMDRVTGMIGLLALSAGAVAIYLPRILANPSLRALAGISVAGFLGGLVCLAAALFAGEALAQWTRLPGVIRTVFAALHEYRRRLPVVFAALAMSAVNQALSCTSVYLALRATGASGLRPDQFFLIVPLGLVTSAVPISPAGIGVGQAAFFALFRIVAPALAAPGTDAYTIFQALSIMVCLTGLFWYVSSKRLADAPAADSASSVD